MDKKHTVLLCKSGHESVSRVESLVEQSSRGYHPYWQLRHNAIVINILERESVVSSGRKKALFGTAAENE